MTEILYHTLCQVCMMLDKNLVTRNKCQTRLVNSKFHYSTEFFRLFSVFRIFSGIYGVGRSIIRKQKLWWAFIAIKTVGHAIMESTWQSRSMKWSRSRKIDITLFGIGFIYERLSFIDAPFTFFFLSLFTSKMAIATYRCTIGMWTELETKLKLSTFEWDIYLNQSTLGAAVHRLTYYRSVPTICS